METQKKRRGKWERGSGGKRKGQRAKEQRGGERRGDERAAWKTAWRNTSPLLQPLGKLSFLLSSRCSLKRLKFAINIISFFLFFNIFL